MKNAVHLLMSAFFYDIILVTTSTDSTEILLFQGFFF